MKLVLFAALAGAGYFAYRYLQQHGAQARSTESSGSDDASLTERVRESVRESGVQSESVQLRVMNGTALLSGSVDSAARDRMLRAILAVPGIRGVRNELEVQGAGAAPA